MGQGKEITIKIARELGGELITDEAVSWLRDLLPDDDASRIIHWYTSTHQEISGLALEIAYVNRFTLVDVTISPTERTVVHFPLRHITEVRTNETKQITNLVVISASGEMLSYQGILERSRSEVRSLAEAITYYIEAGVEGGYL